MTCLGALQTKSVFSQFNALREVHYLATAHDSIDIQKALDAVSDFRHSREKTCVNRYTKAGRIFDVSLADSRHLRNTIDHNADQHMAGIRLNLDDDDAAAFRILNVIHPEFSAK